MCVVTVCGAWSFVDCGVPYTSRFEDLIKVNQRDYGRAIRDRVSWLAGALGNHAVVDVNAVDYHMAQLTEQHDDDVCPTCRRLAPWGCLQCSMPRDEFDVYMCA